MENGIQGTSVQFLPTDYFAVARLDGKIYWLQNSTIVYSVSTSITDTLFVDTSFYGRGDLISGVQVQGEESLSIGVATATCSSSIVADPATSALCVASSSIVAYPSVDTEVLSGTVTVVASSSVVATEAFEWQGQATAVCSSSVLASEITTHTQAMPPLEGWGSDKPYARGVGYFKELTGYAESGFVIPNLVDSYGFVGPLTGAGTSLTGGLGQTDDAVSPMAAIDGLGADYTYGEGVGALEPLTVWAGALPVYDGTMYGVFPEVTMVGVGHENAQNGVSELVPEFTFSGHMGGESNPVFPLVTGTLVASADNGVTCRLDAVVPEVTLTASALNGSLGIADVTAYVTATTSAYGGGYAEIVAPLISLTSVGTVGAIGVATLTFPKVTISASATQEIFGSANIIVPAFSTLYGDLSGVVPLVSVTGIITATSVSSELAYVMDMGIEEMTTYTNYGFDYIVRFGGQYYGIKSNGMYLLEGADDNGTSISSTVKLNDIDFGTAKRKHVPYLYLDTDNNTDITTYVDRTQISTYRSRLGNKRTKLARGPRGRDWAFEIQNVDGNKLDVRNIELFPHIRDRKV
jgi:hypothetical protein